MAKPLNEFGGWLRFFQVVNLIGVIIFPIILLLVVIGTFTDYNYKNAVESLVTMVDIAISVYFSIRILQIIKKRDISVPAAIIKYLLLIMIFSLVFLAIEIPIILWANDGQWTQADTASARSSLQTVVSYLIWSAYFRKSKRVDLYYGNKKLDEIN